MNNELNERVARLERENRRFRMIGALALVVLVGVFLMGQETQPKVLARITARQLDIVDRDGKVRLSLGSDDAGFAAINISDKQGVGRASLGVDPDGTPAVVIGDVTGKLCADFGTDKNGTPMMRLFDPSGKVRVMIALDSAGQPVLSLNDSGENSIWKAP